MVYEYALDEHGNAVDMNGDVVVPSNIVQQFRDSVLRPSRQDVISDFLASINIENAVSPVARARPSPALYTAPITAPRMSAPRRSGGRRGVPSRSQIHNTTKVTPSSGTRTANNFASPTAPSAGQAFSYDAHGQRIIEAGLPQQQIRGGPSGRRMPSQYGLTGSGTENLYVAAPPSALFDASANLSPASGNGLPQDYQPPSVSTTGLDFPSNTYPADDNVWTQGSRVAGQQQTDHRSTYSHPHEEANAHSPLPPASAPQHLNSGPNPTIRVISASSDLHQAQTFTQPQATTFHPLYASLASSLPPSDYITYHTSHSSGRSGLHPDYIMAQEADLQTPVSPVSAHYPSPQQHDAVMTDALPTRKRSHSLMSQQDPALQQHIPSQSHHSRAGSMASMNGTSPIEEYARGSHAFKRGDPPTNSENKFICTFSDECHDLIFDRKCEWSKHMDKHDRPYRCPHSACQKLQGFTYSGGLLRHEREVHGKHGGPKAQLMCPHTDCKRHAGKGFTRRENLNEHMRRVHSAKDGGVQAAALSQLASISAAGLRRGDGGDVFAEDEQARLTSDAMAAQAVANAAANGMSLEHAAKRKRDDGGGSMHDGYEELRDELKRLRGDAEIKEQEIQRLQRQVLQYRQEATEAQDELARLRQQQQDQQPSQQQQPAPPTSTTTAQA